MVKVTLKTRRHATTSKPPFDHLFCSGHSGNAVFVDVVQSHTNAEGSLAMARKKSNAKTAQFTMFNVLYEDGSITSNRRVANDVLDQSFGDDLLDLALTAIREQDNDIARRSNRRRAKIKSISKA